MGRSAYPSGRLSNNFVTAATAEATELSANLRGGIAVSPARPHISVSARVRARLLPAAVRHRFAVGQPLPGWRDALTQVMLWALADLLYEGVRGLVLGHQSAALANARSLVSLERSLGVFYEQAVQRLVLPSHVAIDLANWLYANAQFTVNVAFLAFLYVYRNDVFYFVRNMFFVSMGIALLVHLSVPVAPPRMLPQYGFVDTIQQVAHVNQDSGAISLFVNPYAAMPSMHMCFALLVGVTGVLLGRSAWVRAVCSLYPLIVLAAIVVTANHFFLDALAGAITAVGAALVAHLLMSRIRPRQWAWSPAPEAPLASRRRTPADARL